MVLADRHVSRRHALIRRERDGFWLFDLGSANGSYLNTRRVTMAQQLTSGDVLRIGQHEFVFELSGNPPAAATEMATALTTLEPQAKERILLTSDVQGFMGISEKLSPDELAPLIGSWYAETERILEDHGATLDKFIGDCVLASWEATSAESRLAAVETARRLQQSCDNVQRQFGKVLEEAGLAFRTGTAMHIGPASYGYLGPGKFTLLGESVNLVFRLEAMTRKLKERILVSGEFLAGWGQGEKLFRALGPHRVKGREQAVDVYALRLEEGRVGGE